MNDENFKPKEKRRSTVFLTFSVVIVSGILFLLFISKLTGWSPFSASGFAEVRDAEGKVQQVFSRKGKADDIQPENIEILYRLASHYSGELKLEADEVAALKLAAGITEDALLYCRRIGARRYRSTMDLSKEKWMEIMQAGLPQYRELATLFSSVLYKPAERITPEDIEGLLADEQRAALLYQGLEEIRGIPPGLSADYASHKNHRISEWAVFAYEYN